MHKASTVLKLIWSVIAKSPRQSTEHSIKTMPIPLLKDDELPDFFKCDTERKKIEVLSCRIEYDKQLPSSKSISIPFGFFHFNTQLDRYAMDWYSSNIKSDLREEEEKVFFMLPHRHIMTGDVDVFDFNGRTFDRIDLIFGRQSIYWRFSFPLQSGESYEQKGKSFIDVGNCPCCIGKQYKRVIEKVRGEFDREKKAITKQT